MNIIYAGFDLLPKWKDAIKNEVFTLSTYFPSKILTIHGPNRSLLPYLKQDNVSSYMLFNLGFSKRIVFGLIPKKLESRGYTHLHFFASDPRVLTKSICNLNLKKILTLVDSGFNLDKITNVKKNIDNINKDIDILVVETKRQEKLAKSIGVNIPIKIIPYGVDINLFKPKPIPSKPFNFLFASSPIKKKQLPSRGINLLLEAFSQINNSEIRLTYVTREGLLNEISEMISKYGLNDQVDLLYGNVDMPTLYSEHYACIIPYTSPYGVMDLPHTAIESIASGRPVISTDVIGLSDILTENQCGVITSISVDGLVAAMLRLYDDYQTFQRNCRKTAERLFRKERFIEDYENLYQEVKNA